MGRKRASKEELTEYILNVLENENEYAQHRAKKEAEAGGNVHLFYADAFAALKKAEESEEAAEQPSPAGSTSTTDDAVANALETRPTEIEDTDVSRRDDKVTISATTDNIGSKTDADDSIAFLPSADDANFFSSPSTANIDDQKNRKKPRSTRHSRPNKVGQREPDSGLDLLKCSSSLIIFTENQLKVFNYLVQVHKSELNFTNTPMIGKATGISKNGIKKILKSLRERNLVQTKRHRTLGGITGFWVVLEKENLDKISKLYNIK